MSISTRLLSSILAAIFALYFGLAPAAFAAPAPSTNPADAVPGQLRLPLTVHERGGVARRGAVVTSGVPFPPGFLKDVKQLRVVDEAGKPVPTQAHLMLPWRPPTYDNSVQWALVSFVADVAANSTATYTLTDAGGPETSAASPISLNQEGENISITTGNASFVIPKSGTALISSAKLGNKAVIGGEGLRAVITTGDWPDKKLKLGDKQIASHEKVTVEEAGPLRTVIAIDGMYTPGDVNKKMYDFTTRLYFEAGNPSVRVFHVIGNGYMDPTLVDGLRRIPIWPIKDASLVADLAIDGATDVLTLADGKPISAKASDEPLVVYQDSSGGDNWRDLKGTNYDQWLAPSTKGKTVPGVTFRGYKATQGTRELATGNRADGAIEVGAANGGLSAAVRSFSVQHPIAIGASAKQLSIELLSGRFSQLFHLDSGQRKSWDVRLWLNGEAKTSLADRHNEQETLFLFRVDPRWMVLAGECGAWPEGFAVLPTPKTRTGEPAPVPGRVDKSKFDGTNSGWDWYGWISGFNSGGGHWNQTPTLNDWLLRGNGEQFDLSESRSLWAADLGAIHFKQIDLSAFWYWIKGGSGNVNENRIKIETFPNYQKRDFWGLWDSGHMGMLPWTEYYLLTGDAHIREALIHLGIRARAYLWSSNHDDKNDGTGPMARAINWCKKQDADKDPDFKLATRYNGWPLYGLAHYYRLTGDPELLAESQNIAKSFRNTARYSPIGFMVLQINKAGDRAVYGGQGPFDPYLAQSASQCYAHFQQALMCQGLVEYYLMSKDIEALDPLIAFSDLLTHRAMLHDETGKKLGWTYAFGDYWGPYTLEQAKKNVTFLSSNAPCLQIIGWVAHFTGRKDFREAIAEPSSGELPSNSQAMAADMVTLHPRADLQPPAAIKDLKAEALGGGRVKLTWSTPAGDPAWYQLKWSTAKIMERIEGWPDRSLPLPQDQAEWEAKAAAFNAKQVNFWAANNAAGVPLQSAAGPTQSVTLEKLPPGKVNFAIKAWDAASNMSDISNVIEIELK